MRYTRRRFVQTVGTATTGLTLAACAGRLSDRQTAETPVKVATDPKTLYIYTWTNYIDKALSDRFNQETGIKVVADIFDSNETMLSKIQAGGGNSYSVIYPSDYMVQQMSELGLLQVLDPARLKELGGLFPNYQNPNYDPGNKHSVPAGWGTTGLTYNSQLDPDPQDWQYLWDNADQIKGKLTLLNDAREVAGVALKSLGFSYNTAKPTEIQQAFDRLKTLKSSIASFTTDAWRDQLLAGDLAIAMTYSSDAIEVTQANSALKYVIPSSGTSLWTDTMVIPKTAPNPEAAYQWINFVMQPEIAAEASARLKFATPSKQAYDKLPEAKRQNRVMFPSEALLAKCEVLSPLPKEITDLYDRFWTSLTA